MSISRKLFLELLEVIKLKLISGTSAFFNRLFETSSGPRTTASKQFKYLIGPFSVQYRKIFLRVTPKFCQFRFVIHDCQKNQIKIRISVQFSPFLLYLYHIGVKNTPYYTVQAQLITAESSDKQDKITNMTDYQTSNRKTRPLTRLQVF